MADGKVTITVDLDGKSAQNDVNSLKSAFHSLGSTGSKVGSIFKSVFSANLLSGAFMSVFGAAKAGMQGLMGEAISASDSLQKFEQTMSFGGYDNSTIKQARADVKSYADDTVYSIEDIANTTAQLAANGITNYKQLTESAGNLNAVAGGNADTFKTVGMVMTQTAGAGKLTTENWNQLADAIPGASGKLQKAMLDAGAYTGNFREAMEKGEITADEFNSAIISLGEGQREAATNTSTFEGAIGDLQATIGTGLLTVVDKVKPKITEMINALSGLAGKVNFDEVANKINTAITKVGEFFNKFKDTGALTALGGAFKNVGAAIGNFFAALGGGKGDWTNFGTTLGNIVKWLSKAASGISGFIAKMEPSRLQSWIATFASVIGGFKLFSAITGNNPIGSILSSLGEKFTIFGNKGKAGTDKAGSGTGLLGQLFQGLGTLIGSVASGISTILQGLGTAISTVAQGFGQAAAMASPAQWLSMGAAMLMVGAGVALAASGIYILVQAAIQLASAGTGAQIAMLALGVGIAALAGIFALLGPALTASAVGILAFGASVALIGAGIAIAAVGLSVLVNAFANAQGAITATGQAISTAAQGIGQGIQSALSGAAQVVQSFGTAIKSALDGVANVFRSVGDSVKSAFEGIGNVIKSVGSSIKSVLDGISGVIESIGKAALNAGKGFDKLADGVVKITNTKLGDMAASLAAVAKGVGKISAHSEGLSQAGSGMKNLGTGMRTVSTAASTAVSGLTMFDSKINSLKTVVMSLPQMLTTAASGFSRFTSQAVSGVAGLSAINAPIATFKSQIMTITPALMMAGVSFASFGSKAMVISSAFATVGGLITAFNARVMTISTTMTMASTSFAMLGSRILAVGTALMTVSTSFMQVSSSATNASSQVRNMATSTQAVISAFNAMRGQVQSSMQAILAVIRSVGSQMKSQGRQIGQQTAQNIAQGIRGGIGQSTGAMHSLMGAVRSAGMSGVGSMRGIGAMIGQGLAAGMMSALGAVTAAANALVAQAERAARAKAQIHSPSRLFRDSVGRFLPMGVAVGIEKNTKYVDKAMGGMYDNIQAFSYKAEDIIGVGKTKLSKVVQVKSDFEKAVKATVNVKNSGQKSALDELFKIGDKLDMLVDKSTDIVLETGALVGGTVDAYTKAQTHNAMVYNRMRGIL